MLANEKNVGLSPVETKQTTVRAVLEQVVGMSSNVAQNAMNVFRVEIDGATYQNLDDKLNLRLGAWVDLEGYTRLKVIKAHFRTLEFYRG